MPKNRGGYPGGAPNMQNLMKQAQNMQKRMLDAQKEIEEKEIESTSGGGAIKVVVTGKKFIKEISIDQSVVDPDDVEMLQDLILTAVNEGLRQIDALSSESIERVTGGIGLPPGLI
jgi:DNA-binding YbaB/EbfC family protein